MIRFNCALCGKVLKTPDNAAGRKGSCPRCGKRLIVPSAASSIPPNQPASEEPSADLEPTFAFDDDELDGNRAGTFGKRQRRQALILTLILVGAVLVIGFWALLVFNGNAQIGQASNANKQPESTHPRQADPRESESDRIKSILGNGLVAGGVIVFIGICFACLAYIVFVIRMMIWVAQDAYARGIEGALWAIIYIAPHVGLTFPWLLAFPLLITQSITGLVTWIIGLCFLVPCSWVGLLVYVASRRPGVLMKCDHCLNKKLAYVTRCPNCGTRT